MKRKNLKDPGIQKAFKTLGKSLNLFEAWTENKNMTFVFWMDTRNNLFIEKFLQLL